MNLVDQTPTVPNVLTHILILILTIILTITLNIIVIIPPETANIVTSSGVVGLMAVQVVQRNRQQHAVLEKILNFVSFVVRVFFDRRLVVGTR